MLNRLCASLSYLVLCIGWLWALDAGAVDTGQQYPQARRFFPEADRFGEFAGEPPAATVYRGETVLGYLYRTNDIAKIPAYSGKPVNVLVGIDTAGKFVGAEVLEHHEPILLVGIPEQALTDFVNQYQGKASTDRIRVGAGQRAGYVNVDAITGATVTVMVINEAIMRSARKVLSSKQTETGTGSSPMVIATVRPDVFERAGWNNLTGNGLVRRLYLSRGEVDKALLGSAAEDVDNVGPEVRGEPFIDLFYTYLNAPIIGRNLLGDSQYSRLMDELQDGEHAIAVLANGKYSFKGSGYVRGGIFDRMQLRQYAQPISFRDLDYQRLSDVYAEDMPEFREMAIFVVRAGYGFDPGRPWQLELLVRRQIGPLESVFTSFSSPYALPDRFLRRSEPPASIMPEKIDEPETEPIWIGVWRERVFRIAVLGAGLLGLTLILIFQDYLTRHPKLLFYVRHTFLIYTVVFIGWYALAQLSVVNVLTFINAVMHEFSWDTFLIDPMMFILWCFVAITLLLWGRGIYCGWLCPYGAIQELVNEIARRFKVRQFEFPFVVHERLWALKYIVLLVLFGISLQSLAEAEKAAEIEPFKTAITLRFQREWGYVFYAGLLIAVSVVNRKFYCRYLCPLGAALAIPARIRLFDWLKRHKECGKPCRICANECEVKAIHPTGEINANECHYCLDCQVTYFNQYKCPPMVAKRKRRERAATARQSVQRIEQTLKTKAGLERIGIKVEPKS